VRFSGKYKNNINFDSKGSEGTIFLSNQAPKGSELEITVSKSKINVFFPKKTKVSN
jgi:hypothetical protein